MIKVKHSKFRRTILLELSGEIELGEVEEARAELERALDKLGYGYTLVEAFRGGVKISQEVVFQIAELVGLCYLRSRIWRVIRLFLDGGIDPGLCILHRTRWFRNVPVTEAYTARLAMAMAEEEARENSEWVGFSLVDSCS